MTFPPVKHPDWLMDAMTSEERTYRLIRSDHLPEVLRGRFLMTGCLRILRCVFGSDEESMKALRVYPDESHAMQAEAELYSMSIDEGEK